MWFFPLPRSLWGRQGEYHYYQHHITHNNLYQFPCLYLFCSYIYLFSISMFTSISISFSNISIHIHTLPIALLLFISIALSSSVPTTTWGNQVFSEIEQPGTGRPTRNGELACNFKSLGSTPCSLPRLQVHLSNDGNFLKKKKKKKKGRNVERKNVRASTVISLFSLHWAQWPRPPASPCLWCSFELSVWGRQEVVFRTTGPCTVMCYPAEFSVLLD